MKKHLFFLLFICLLTLHSIAQKNPIRVLVLTAHPDEAEEYVGGTIASFAEHGAEVQIASLTNGDVGHWTMTKEAIAERRKQEAIAAGKILGASYLISNHHDGELEPSIEVRKEIVTIIRKWNPDIVITFMEMLGGGHPDNMAVATAVRQGAGLSFAPLFLPEIPALTKRPVFLVVRDYYSKKFTHQADVVIPIDKTYNKKLDSFAAHASQFFEFAPYQRGILNEVPKEPKNYKTFFEKYWGDYSAISDSMRNWLNTHYGEVKGKQFEHAEEFEYASFSRRLDKEELLKLFPMLRNSFK
ncbi:PIG-L family deacetylase [Solitalea sp. MAHUQ-68]|uniref:PIG-L family deacetylase n=1 Tax=Solitalea agri TaxID=2953739 RepID=A0A9X2JD98_9SPHI|nr:PIG-L deacetylase family protein [Solitalea agri]MCO4293903.1 PIG-L family deacetylase [Solitalea agri]